MKNIIIIVLLALCHISLSAQKLSPEKVPAAAKAKFASLYPKAENAHWEKEGADFEAGFTLGQTHMSVVIDAQGKLKETETKMTVAELPKKVQDYLAKNKPGAKITEAAKIVYASGKMRYEAEVNGKDMLFDEQGNFVK
jgi:hypothetical protein